MKNANRNYKNHNRNANEDVYMSKRHWEENYKAKYERKLVRRMKRKAIYAFKQAIKVIAFGTFMCCAIAMSGTSDYEDRTGCSTYKAVVLEDEQGQYVRLDNGHEFYTETEYELGDKVYVQLYRNGTNNYFKDDSIVNVTRRWF